MIIDEFEYWEKLPQDFSDPWFKTLCYEVKIYNYELSIVRSIIKILFIMKIVSTFKKRGAASWCRIWNHIQIK